MTSAGSRHTNYYRDSSPTSALVPGAAARPRRLPVLARSMSALTCRGSALLTVRIIAADIAVVSADRTRYSAVYRRPPPCVTRAATAARLVALYHERYEHVEPGVIARRGAICGEAGIKINSWSLPPSGKNSGISRLTTRH
jgi:hypothetical protein